MDERCGSGSKAETGSAAAKQRVGASMLQSSSLGLLLAAVGFSTMPLLLWGYPFTHSYGYNVSWASQFVDLIWAGVLFPRWMPRAFDGLGAPSFIFYAPLPFYLMALVDLATFRQLSAEQLVAACSAALIVVSALTMRRWLVRFVDVPRAAIGAAIYVLAPYHLFDVHVRGALGEVAAYAILPMLACALEDTLRAPRKSWYHLGLWTGLLILSHLPSALAVGVVVVPLRILGILIVPERTAWEKIGFVSYAVLGGLLGLGISSFYWVPALSLLDIASFHYGETGYFDPRNWVFLNWPAWPEPRVVTVLLCLALSLAVISAVGLFYFVRSRYWIGLSWAVSGVFIFLMMAGAVPFVWNDSSPLSRIQFPWRLLFVAEFMTISIGMILSQRPVSRINYGILGVSALMIFVIFLGASAFAFRFYVSRGGSYFREYKLITLDRGMEATEYLPRGHSFRYTGGGISNDRFLAISSPYPPARSAWVEPPDAARVSVRAQLAGDMEIHVEADAPARIVLRRFFYPLWRLEPASPTDSRPALFAHGEDRLLVFDVPPGARTYRLEWSPPAIVPISLAISAASLLMLTWMIFVPSRRRTEAAVHPPPGRPA